MAKRMLTVYVNPEVFDLFDLLRVNLKSEIGKKRLSRGDILQHCLEYRLERIPRKLRE